MFSSNAFTESLLLSLGGGGGGGNEGKRESERERRKSGWLWVEQATDGRVEKFVIWRDSEGEGLRDNKANEKQT